MFARMQQPQTQTRPAVAGQPAAAAPAQAPLPPEPQSIEQTGLSLGFLADLALKTLYLRGQMSGTEIASSLGLPLPIVVERVLDFLKSERLVEIRGGAGVSAATYQYVVVGRGSEKAQEALLRSQYVGRAPVPLSMYIASVKAQTIANVRVTQEELERAFSHLVIPHETVSQIGPDIKSGQSILIFRPTGNGKTTIAEVLV